MYNEEQKTAFIRSYTSSIATANALVELFNDIEECERKWGADICTRSKGEIEEALKGIFNLPYVASAIKLKHLQAYAKWCIENHVDGACDGMLGVQTLGLDVIRRKMVSGPVHLQKILDQVFPAEELQTVSEIYRCMLWMAFSGLEQAEAEAVKVDDVHLEKMEIVVGENSYPVYRESLVAFRNACTLNEFRYFHPNYTNEAGIMRKRAEGDTLFRGYADISQTPGAADMVITKAFTAARKKGATDSALGYHSVWKSGMYYRLFEKESAGIPIDFRGIAISHLVEKNGKKPERQRIYQVRKRLEGEYTAWKSAFRS